MNNQELEQKIRSLSAKEIIMAMVEGLKNPKTKIDMTTYGEVRSKGICYGCAATNAIIQLSDYTPKEACELYYKVNGVIVYFEMAINALRQGNIIYYNLISLDISLPQIKEPDFEVPYISSDYTQEDLEPYIKLAEMQ